MKKLFLIWLIMSSSSALGQSVAIVLSTSSTVKVLKGAVEKALSRGSSLEVGDTILTSSQASASIKYNNGTLVTLGEQSRYVILAYSPKENEVSITAELKNGKLNSTTTRKSKKQILKTPVVSMAIFGTEYKVYVPIPPKKTFIQVDSGRVIANNVLLNVGQGYVATSKGISPTKFPAAGIISAKPSASTGTSSSNYLGAETTSSVSSNLIPSAQTSAVIAPVIITPVIEPTTLIALDLACSTI